MEMEPLEAETCGAPLYAGPEEEADETIQVEFACDGGMIVVQLPADWQWEADDLSENAYAMGISFRPDAESDGWLRLQYYPTGFGVCGTGLEEKPFELSNGLSGHVGYYDGSLQWSFIGFHPDHPNYALTVDGADWVSAYEDQIFTILSGAQLG